MPVIQKLKHVIEIRDVEVFGDALFYTLWVFEEDMLPGPGEFLRLKPDAKIFEIRLQEKQDPYKEVRISQKLINRARVRFSRRKRILTP